MKTLFALAFMVVISGCATFSSKWSEVEEGQSPNHVKEIMGNPESFSGDVMRWQADSFTTCDVYFSGDKVYSKGCSQDSAARDHAMMMYQGYIQNQQARPAFTPTQPYQMRLPSQTNCTSNSMGGTVYTNCSGH